MLTDEQVPSNGKSPPEAMPSVAPDQPPLNGSLASSDTVPETTPAGDEAHAIAVNVAALSVPNPPFEDGFKRLGGLRDGLLVSVGGVYVLGRLVWAYQSKHYNLGIIPVEQSQYFVAGFVPTVIAVLVWFGVLSIKSFLEIVGRLYVPNTSRRRRIVQKSLTVGYGLVGVAGFLLWVGEYFWTGRHYAPSTSLPYAVSLLTTTCVFMAGMPLLLRVRGNQVTEKMQFDPFEWTLTALYPVLVGAISISMYGCFVYPLLSQEYGGARPRVAYLDLDRSKLSPDTLIGLLPPKGIQSKNLTVRTVLLDVFYAGKDTFLVKPYRSWPDNRTYEIPSSSILGRTWADPAKFPL